MSWPRAAWLLDRLTAEGSPISPREHLALAEAVAALAPDDDSLAAMVASLVIHNAEDWDRVYARCWELLQAYEVVQTPPTRPREARSHRRWAVVGLVATAMVLGALVAWRAWPTKASVTSAGVPALVEAPTNAQAVEDSGELKAPPVAEPPVAEPPVAEPPVAEPFASGPASAPPTATITLIQPARTTSSTLSQTMTTPARSTPLTLVPLGLITLGLTLIVAPIARAARLAVNKARGRDEADRLYREGKRGELALYIPRAPLLRPDAVDAAATLLARRPEDHPSPHLHIPATVNTAAREAGRIHPHFWPALGGPPLLVWVDVEDGDQPLLWAVEAVLARWTAQGLPFERLSYNRSPERLVDPVTREGWTLSELSRRRGDAPLLLFSRLDDPQEYHGTRNWPKALTCWTRRALIDLNPLHREERWLTQAGLPRLPFTDEGLVAAATLLSLGERLGPPPRPPALPPMDDLTEPLRQWMVCACCVPNPTWAQLDELRRELPALREALPDPRMVVLLLAAYRQPGGAEPISDRGDSLALPRAQMASLLAAQRGPDGLASTQECAALRVLLKQLDRARPDVGTLADWRKRLRMACYELTLGKRDIEDVLKQFADSPVRDELERRLAQEDRVRLIASAGAGVGLGSGLNLRLAANLEADGPLTPQEVGTAWARLGWTGRAVGLAGWALLSTVVWWTGAPEEVVRATRTVELPEEREVKVEIPGESGGGGILAAVAIPPKEPDSTDDPTGGAGVTGAASAGSSAGASGVTIVHGADFPGTLQVKTSSSGAQKAQIFLSGRYVRDGVYSTELPQDVYEVKVVCPIDAGRPGLAPVKRIAVQDAMTSGIEVDCDTGTVTEIGP